MSMKSYCLMLNYPEQIDAVFRLKEKMGGVGYISSFGVISGDSFVIETYFGYPSGAPRRIVKGQLFANITIDRGDFETAVAEEFGEPDLGCDFYCLEDLPTTEVLDDDGRTAFAVIGMTYLPVNSEHNETLKEILKHTHITFLIEPNYKSDVGRLVDYLQSDRNNDLHLLGLFSYTGADVHFDIERWQDGFVLDKLACGEWYIAAQPRNGLRTAYELSEHLLENNIDAMSAICEHATRQIHHDESLMASIHKSLSPLLDDDIIKRTFCGYPIFPGMKKLSLSSRTLSRYANKINDKVNASA